MKKILILALTGTGFAIGSCNKSYNCYCHEQVNDKDTVFVYSQKERSVKKAERSCENMSDSDGKCTLNK